MPRSDVMESARFDPKLRLYLFLQGVVVLAATLVGLLLVPIWLFVGPPWARRYYERLACDLTERSLVVRKGIVFRSETSIPLDQIQDLTVKYGPVLDWLGLAKLSLVTAGQHPNQTATAALTGIVDPTAFRDRVLEQRDRVVERVLAGRPGGPTGHPGEPTGTGEVSRPPGEGPPAAGDAGPGVPGSGASDELLTEIRDTLRRIEALLERA